MPIGIFIVFLFPSYIVPILIFILNSIRTVITTRIIPNHPCILIIGDINIHQHQFSLVRHSVSFRTNIH